MSSVFLVILMIAGVVAAVIVAFLTGTFTLRWVSFTRDEKKSRKGRIRESERRVSRTPHDPTALLRLADAYYEDGSYDKAMQHYRTLIRLAEKDKNIDDFHINMRYGLAAMEIKAYNEAYRSLMAAQSIKKGNYEIEASLGRLEYMKKNYSKAAVLLQRALTLKPARADLKEYLGLCAYRLKRYKVAIPWLQQALMGGDKNYEVRFALGRSQGETGQIEQALAVFHALMDDPVWGPQSALYAGMINIQRRRYEEAVRDLKEGLRHERMHLEIALALRYQLAIAYTHLNDINNTYHSYQEVFQINPSYKDVATRVKKYKELYDNRNLQHYLFSGPRDIAHLCRRLTELLMQEARIQVTNVNVQGRVVDILIRASAKKWEDTVLLRFLQQEVNVRENQVREFHSSIKEAHAGRGFLITPSEFEEDARAFTTGRFVYPVDRAALKGLLKKLGRIESARV